MDYTLTGDGVVLPLSVRLRSEGLSLVCLSEERLSQISLDYCSWNTFIN